MHRRDVLKVLPGAIALPAVGWHLLTRSAPYRPLDSVSIPGAKEAVIGPEGDTAYVAATTGFVTVDISTARNLSILAERRDLLADHEEGPLRNIWDVKVEGDRLIVAGPANFVRGARGFLVYDVSNPASPERLAVHETDFPIHNCFIRDGRVYLTGNDRDGNPLVIVDVSDDTPEEVGRWSLVDHDARWADVHWHLRWLHDVWVQDGVAYLAHWDAGTWLVDVSDPAAPGYIADISGRSRADLAAIPGKDVRTEVLELPGNDHSVSVNDAASVLGIGKESWNDESTDRNGGPAGIELWDITNPSTPEKLSTIAPPEPAHDGGTTAAIAGAGFNLGDGFHHMGCHECGQEADDLWTTAHNFDIVGDRLLSAWYQGGVKVHDISDPANPVELAWWRQPEEASFWTAQLANPSFFVASSLGRHGDGKGTMYTFPNEAGQQQDPPPLTGSSNGEPKSTPAVGPYW